MTVTDSGRLVSFANAQINCKGLSFLENCIMAYAANAELGFPINAVHVSAIRQGVNGSVYVHLAVKNIVKKRLLKKIPHDERRIWMPPKGHYYANTPLVNLKMFNIALAGAGDWQVDLRSVEQKRADQALLVEAAKREPKLNHPVLMIIGTLKGMNAISIGFAVKPFILGQALGLPYNRIFSHLSDLAPYLSYNKLDEKSYEVYLNDAGIALAHTSISDIPQFTTNSVEC